MISETTEARAIQVSTSGIAVEPPPQHRQPPKEAAEARSPSFPLPRLPETFGLHIRDSVGSEHGFVNQDSISSPSRLGSLKFEQLCSPGAVVRVQRSALDSTTRLERSRLPEPYVEGLGARGSMANYGH